MLFAKQRGKEDQAELLRTLDPRQRIALDLFFQFETVSSRQIGRLFQLQPRTSAQLCKNWVKGGFLEIANPSNRGRTYRLAKGYQDLLR